MSRLARISLIPIAIGQFLVPTLPSLGFGKTNAERALNQGVPPELPLGVFFSIWGIIFLGYLVTAILANARPEHISERLAPPLALAGIGNIVWMLSSQLIGNVLLDFIILLPILFCIWEAAHRLDRSSGYDGTGRSILHGLTVGLFAGWLAVAVSISIPDVARWVLGRGVSDFIWQSLWMALVPAGLFAWLFASRVSKSLWFFVALAWGLIGIAMNNWYRLETHGLAILTLATGIFVIGRRLHRGARGSAA